MNTLKALAAIVFRFLKDTVKIRSVEREDLRKVIKENANRHELFDSLFKKFSDADRDQFKTRYLASVEESKLPSARVHETYFKGLKGESISLERKGFLKSLLKANKDMADILNEIYKKLDTLMTEERVTIGNARMSHIAILGILRQSDTLASWSMYLWSQLIKLGMNKMADIPKYRVDFLLNNVQDVIKTVNHVCNKTGPYSFIREAEQLKRKESDLVLGATNTGTTFLDLMTPGAFSVGFLDNIASALSALNVFRWGGEKWDDWMYERHQRDKETLQWMKMHVDLLRMDMMDIDQNDPRYQQMLKIIAAYDVKISEYDKKVKEYEEGE